MSCVDRQSIDNLKKLLPNYLESKHGINIKVPFTCLNPEHEDRHPSMCYTSKYNICKCFSCGTSYDIFDLIGIDYGITSFKEKLNIVSRLYPNMSDVKFERYDIIESNSKIVDFTNYFKKCMSKMEKTDYLEKRKINSKLLKKYSIGFDDKKKMIIFPINKNCYFARSVIGNNKMKSKGISYLWNEKLLNNSNEKTLIYVTESIIDSLSIETIDPDVITIALNGLPNYKRLIKIAEEKNFKGTFVLAFDNDKTGKIYQSIVKEELDKININSFSISIISGLKEKDLNEALVNNKESLVKSYNYFNNNFKKILDSKLEKREKDSEISL